MTTSYPWPDTWAIAEMLEKIARDPELLEIARKAIEDELIEYRDSGIGILRRNGLVVYGKDGSPSSIIRFGSEHGLQLGLQEIAAHLKRGGTVSDGKPEETEVKS
jgi:hypothetical protein